ncbi:hypothetical protein Pan258_59320 [Symmachiella dynata]|uniref:Carboxypeptidase regulatory-like domain-containing protein n=1 Tax=Symmachiella dynata TaxID=2527995 RepID=A0A517ZYH5_9PLAN|nr:hypothetical protein [Symmachiella dynata]QDT51835.1 hypothetical protein Pan258_59320 [Symmachiella dynata]QDU47535.1 hypothetical protein Mal52_60700 [Symmachiella dynata]
MRLRCLPRLENGMSVGFLGVIVCAALSIVGCGKSDRMEGELEVYPVTGVVTFSGQQIPDATLVLHPVTPPADGKPFYSPRAIVGPDGAFEFTTYRKGDGAPPGEYNVAFSWLGPLEGLDEDEQDLLPEQMPRRLTRPETSGITITVKEGVNELDEITLK